MHHVFQRHQQQLIRAEAVDRVLAGLRRPAEGPVGVLLRDKKVPPFKTLFEQAVSLGDAKIHPCSMAMDILGFESEHLEDYIGEAMGLTMFLDEAKSGQVWSF